jgi:hypothetical protein
VDLVEQPTDTGSACRRPPLIGRIGPGLAEGRLWVRSLPLPPKELAKRLEKSHAELVDSAVTAIVQGYLDSIALTRNPRGSPELDDPGGGEEVRTRLAEHLHRRAQDSVGRAGLCCRCRKATSTRIGRITI